jgi:predicted GNAT superfamily acetyltransferase
MIVQPQEQQSRTVSGGDGIIIRRVGTSEEYAACVAVQLETWGADFSERVPATILRVAQYIGGVTAGAFTASGELLGFVFGMTGVREGRLVHWSDLLAVRRAARDRGLGRRLKLFQRELVRELGVDTMYWTFDPLVARNAHLNLCRLGARVAEYAPDMYGDRLSGALQQGLGTDRFIVKWDLGASVVPSGESDGRDDSRYSMGQGSGSTIESSAERPQVLPRITLEPHEQELVDAPAVEVEIPGDIDAVFLRDPGVARRWRDTTRRAFVSYLARGYEVDGFERDAAGRAHYRLTAHGDR